MANRDSPRLGVRERIPLRGGHSFRLLRWDESLSEVQVVLSPWSRLRIKGEGAHWHYHQALELIVFESGRGTRFFGDHIAAFEAGDVVLLGSNVPHTWQTQGATSGWAVQWLFPPEHPFWAFPETQGLAAHFAEAGRGIRFRGAAAARIAQLFPPMAGAAAPGRLGALLQMLAITAGATIREREFLSSRRLSPSAESGHQDAVRVAVRFLLANFREPIRLDQLLAATGLSKSTFSRRFHRHAGRTVSEFLQEVRLEAACRDLVSTLRPIAEIAHASGFSEISFFNRLFQRARGCTPSAFRRRTARRVCI
jgi:AraC-like DNA-binding protein/mannose-6-phosphate isomerase-like protein (cupin superfamily)